MKYSLRGTTGKCKHSRTESRVGISSSGGAVLQGSRQRCDGHFWMNKTGTRQRHRNTSLGVRRRRRWEEACADEREVKGQSFSKKSYSAEKGICTAKPSLWINIILISRVCIFMHLWWWGLPLCTSQLSPTEQAGVSCTLHSLLFPIYQYMRRNTLSSNTYSIVHFWCCSLLVEHTL